MRFSNQMRRPSAALLLLILLTAPHACKRKQPQIPPPPRQLPAPAPEPEPPPAEITITPGQPVVAPPVEITPPPVEPEPVEPSVPEPEPSVPAVEPVPAPEPPSAPAPLLTPLLSPQDQTRYRAETDASLARARRSLGILAQRQLTTEQQTSLNRVRTFISQAETVRSRDLATAAGLARRADILSAELVSNTQ